MFMSDTVTLLISLYIVSILLCFADQKVTERQIIIIGLTVIVMVTLMYRISSLSPSCEGTQITQPLEAFSNEPPVFDDLVNQLDSGATPEEKKQIHNGKDKYDFLDSQAEYKAKDDLYYVNKGDLIDKQWQSKYVILDTKNWKVYEPPPPVCLDRKKPCNVCPVSVHSDYLDLSDFPNTEAIIPKYSTAE